MTVQKGMVLVDQHGTEWVAISDPDDTGRFRCGNEYGMGWGNVNVVVVKDADTSDTSRCVNTGEHRVWSRHTGAVCPVNV